MKIAGIVLPRLVKELKEKLLRGKINKIYVDFDRVSNTKKELFIECYVPNQGKQMLRIILPDIAFISSVKPDMPTTPDGYCKYLRKYLKNARILNIEQMGAERIIRITVDALTPAKKESVTYYLYIELFSKGNFIMTNSDNVILSPLEIQNWSERKVAPKQVYTFPKRFNILKISEEDLAKAIEMSEKETLVTTLALDFGLGGLYAEEICARAKINKDTKKPAKADIKKLHSIIQDLKEEIIIGPVKVISKDDKTINIVPCTIKKYADYDKKDAASFCAALDATLSPEVHRTEAKEVTTKQTKAVTKVEVMIKSQEKQIEQSQVNYEKNQKIGEAIYENYQVIEQLLKDLTELRKTKSWKEIKKGLKDHKVIKQINEKNKEIIIEL